MNGRLVRPFRERASRFFALHDYAPLKCHKLFTDILDVI